MTLDSVIAVILRYFIEFDSYLQADYFTVVEDRSICTRGPIFKKSYEELKNNLTKILRSFENRAPDQQSGIHCLIICVTQLLTPNNSGGN